MKRRDILRGTGGIAAALLAGKTQAVQAQNDTTTPFELVPDPGVLDDEEYMQVVSIALDDIDDESELTFEAQIVAEVDGLDVSDVDEAVVGQLEGFDPIAGIAGDFDRPEPGEAVDERDGWRIADDADARLGVASRDDLVAAAGSDGDERVDRVEAAADAALGENDTARDAVEFLDTVFDRLGDRDVVFYIGTLEGFTPGDGKLEAFGAGFEIHPNEFRGVTDEMVNEYVFEPADDDELEVEDVEEIVEELDPGVILELDADVEDGLGVAETVVEAPPERDRDAAPDADIDLRTDADDGTVTFEHTGGEPVPFDELGLWVNGELADSQPVDELAGDAFEAEESFSVDTGTLASVLLRWSDEEENVFYDYAWSVVGEDAFEVEFDIEAGTVELTYTADATADPDRLQLEHSWRVEAEDRRRMESETLTEPIDALGDTLDAGETITVEGVGIHDRVRLELDVPPGPPRSRVERPTLVRFRARPPQAYIHRRHDDGARISFRAEEPRDADEFRVLVDGDETDVQPADEFDTIESGDELELGPVDLGTKIVIEWLAPDEPIIITEDVVEPRGHFEAEYDDSAGTVTLKYVDGDAVDTDDLELEVGSELADTQPADELDILEPGDDLVVDAAPFDVVGLTWRDGDHESSLAHQPIGEELFEATYNPDDDVIEIVYTSEQAADPEPLRLSRFDHRRAADEAENPFAEEYDTLTDGDSITLQDVEPETQVRIRIEGETGAHHRSWTVFSFRPLPRSPFHFEDDGDALVVQYRSEERDADEFRVLADGDETDVQPTDEFDTLEPEDELELGEFETGTEIVIEWTVPDEPTEVQSHEIVPDADFDVEYDEEDSVVRITHAGGDAVEADALSVFVDPVTDRPVDWDGDGTIEAGDETTVDADETPLHVFVLYRERDVLHEEEFED